MGNLGTLGSYFQFFILHTYSFFWFGLLKTMAIIFFLERRSEPQPDLSLASGFNLFLRCQDESYISFNGCDVPKVSWQALLPFGGCWDQSECSATILLLLYIYIDHFIQKDNKGISRVLDTHHHWNVASLALEGVEQILHGSQQNHWGSQCFGYNSSINHLLG